MPCGLAPHAHPSCFLSRPARGGHHFHLGANMGQGPGLHDDGLPPPHCVVCPGPCTPREGHRAVVGVCVYDWGTISPSCHFIIFSTHN